MKLFALLSAALLATGTVAVSEPAAAQSRVVTRTTTTTTSYRPGYRRPHYRGGQRFRTRTVCHNRYRYGRRIRVCERVRVGRY